MSRQPSPRLVYGRRQARRRPLRWLVVVLGVLLGLAALALVVVYAVSEVRLRRTRAITPAPLAVPLGEAAAARGRHVAVAIARCGDCHGENLGGHVMVDDPLLGRLVAPNLTAGAGGIGRSFGDQDYVRAIRHGVGRDGRPLLVMPAGDYRVLSDADLGAIIAYLRQIPPVDSALPQSRVGPLGRALFLAGQIDLLPAERVPQAGPRPAAPRAGPTAEYGAYLAQAGGCAGCHGPGLSGGPIAAAPPGVPPAADITPAGIGGWTEADFFRALREGKRPDGSTIHPFMPWRATRLMTDGEIRALWLYLRTVPARPDGNH